jgi:hypothetical protein
MKAVWDVRELESFANNLVSGYEFETAIMTATQNVARVLHKHLLDNTPIVTGNLRKMWSAGDNLAFTVTKKGSGYVVTFINTARTSKGFEYGLAVNDGHPGPYGNDWVMGRFFVETSLTQTASSTEVEQIVYNELQKWWEGV